MAPPTFFLSTGRCGTQWLALHLARLYSQQLRVAHEPLQLEYEPRRMLALRSGATVEPSDPAKKHIAEVLQNADPRPYVECGHPCWSSLPWIAGQFSEPIRIVHLVRHPVATAASWVARGAFIPPILPHVPERVLSSPFDQGSAFTDYQERWPSMLPFEKCLLYWAEVNAFALDFQRRFNGAWLRLRYEDLFTSGGADQLLQFLAIPPHSEFLRSRSIREDHYRSLPESPCDPTLLKQHPRIEAIALQFGYETQSAGPR